MYLLKWPGADYLPIVKSDLDTSEGAFEDSDYNGLVGDKTHEQGGQATPPTPTPWRSTTAGLLVLACILCGILGDELLRGRLGIPQRAAREDGTRCENPSTRTEWRSLSVGEKQEYMSAVRCLTTTPSKQIPGDSLYDDFAYVHIDTTEDAYSSASFLPYHRYLLHVYESELRESCGYSGSLPYWDWTLDWEDVAGSPVFSNKTGFGSLQARDPAGCCYDSPFSDVQIGYYGDSETRPNCIWRAFSSDREDHLESNVLPPDRLRPSMVEALLAGKGFDDFLSGLRMGDSVHIPNGIAGGFLEFTAPNDPLFILHHCHLDRLWWMWQRAGSDARLYEYGGGDLGDIISLGVLASDVHVEDVMSTEAGPLCYKY